MRTFLIPLSLIISGTCLSQSLKLSYDEAITCIGSGAWEQYKGCQNDSCVLWDCINSILFKVSPADRVFLARVINSKRDQKASYVESTERSAVVDPVTGEVFSIRLVDSVFDFFMIDSATSGNSFAIVTVGNDGYYPGTIKFSSADKFVIARQYSFKDSRPFKQSQVVHRATRFDNSSRVVKSHDRRLDNAGSDKPMHKKTAAEWLPFSIIKYKITCSS